MFDLADGSLVTSFTAAADTVNGLQFHPFMPLAATASGGHSCLAAAPPPAKQLRAGCHISRMQATGAIPWHPAVTTLHQMMMRLHSDAAKDAGLRRIYQLLPWKMC